MYVCPVMGFNVPQIKCADCAAFSPHSGFVSLSVHPYFVRQNTERAAKVLKIPENEKQTRNKIRTNKEQSSAETRNNNRIAKLLTHTDIQLLTLHLIGICFHLNISLLNIFKQKPCVFFCLHIASKIHAIQLSPNPVSP